MSMRTVELVSEWDPVPFDGGYEGLRTLSDQGFSGAVTAGPAQLFMLNGTVVGILDGDIETFEDASGTARTAPHDALPLLAVMQDRADEPRAQYYTEDTSISEVDRTLSDGNFTGFVELSENVLSGDYYLVYHQGRSMSVAWVGSSQRLVTDEEAFDRADGEVGIYQVMPADIEPVELPDPPEPEPDPDETATTTTTAENDGLDRESESDASDDSTVGTEGESVSTGAASTTADADRGPKRSAAGPPGSKAAGSSQGTAVDQQQRGNAAGTEAESRAVSEREAESRAASERAETRERAETTQSGVERTERSGVERAETASETDTPETRMQPEGDDATQAEGASEARTADTAAEHGRTADAEAEPVANDPTATDPVDDEPEPVSRSDSGESTPAATAAESAGSDESVVLETRSIPSLDPERSQASAEGPSGRPASATAAQPTGTDSAPTTDTQSTSEAEAAAETAAGPQAQSGQQSGATAELEAKVDEREREITQLEADLDELAAENRELATENEELAAERDRLLADLEEARAEIQRLEEQLEAADTPAAGGRQLSAAEAIDGTNLFVRYHSKGEATLAKAQDGSVDRTAVEENLRLEYHTQFEADDAVVDGEEYETFLQDSIHYRFVDWLVRSLLYEIRDTGHQSAMGVLFDALPAVDRAELNGNVGITYTEDGEQHRSQEQFDVVVRDRMGNPLVVANINDSRQPATDGQMTDIVRNAERVGNASDSLSAAFLVTSSFFEPEALETAKEATSSGLFSRDKRKSFVNLSRKGGYHLCLLEARNREFHLAVPEL